MNSIWRTPGITGDPGKWPSKYASSGLTLYTPIACESDNSCISSINKKGGLWGIIFIIWSESIKGFFEKSISGAIFFLSDLIISETFFANLALIVWPGLLAITFPLIGIPIKARSPTISSNLCLAASFL